MPCLPASTMTPCLLPLFAFAPVFIHHHVRQDHPVLQGLPCRQPHTGTALVQLVHRFCVLHPSSPFVFLHLPSAASSIQFMSRGSQGLHWAAGYLPVLAQGSQRLHLGSLATPFKWPVGWHMACRVRVSCHQQLKTEKEKKGDLLNRP